MRNFAGKVLTVEAGAVVQQKGCEAVRLRRSHRSLQPDGVGGHIQGDQQHSGDLLVLGVRAILTLLGPAYKSISCISHCDPPKYLGVGWGKGSNSFRIWLVVE